eukprot:GFUD01031169.1.p1 GENE.GFUD01031169.1~~GFUD01031169.1.p1  ORF type:complete len:369 (+),score=110.59 GFUD01031169.1:135-1241(+)
MFEGGCVSSFSEMITFSYDWKITNFNRYLKIYKRIQTPPITIPHTDGLVCSLVCNRYDPGGEVSKIKPNAHLPETDVQDAVLFNIEIVSENCEAKLAGSVEILFDDVSLSGSFGDETEDSFIDWTNMGSDGIGGWNIIAAQNLYYHLNGYAGYSFPAFFAPNQGKLLEMKFKIFYPGEKTDVSSHIYPPTMGQSDHIQMFEDIKSLMMDFKTSDIVIECQEKKFHCHKIILGARSPVFSRMFDTDMKETRSGVITVDDIDVDILEAVIEYIYTDDITKDVEDTAMIVYAADKYELRGLLEICFRKFKDEMEDHQLVDILILSERHNLRDFKDLAMKKIMADKTKFLNEIDFQTKMENHPQLLFELFKI